MFEKSKAFSSFSVNDIKVAKNFYKDILGLEVTEEHISGCGIMLTLHFQGGGEVLIYEKKDHVPATFTILNFPVNKIINAVKELNIKGINFIHYEGNDELEINHSEGPLIAWFKDPAGNFLAVMEEELEKQEMMKIKEFVSISKEKAFEYWTRPTLLEKWAYPNGMTLKIPNFEAKLGGKYTFEHRGGEGLYSCTGYFKEFIENERLVQIETVIGPDGKIMFENLECITDFIELGGETEIVITQKGFQDQKAVSDCREGWKQSLARLKDLLVSEDQGVVFKKESSQPIESSF